jgi:hypothetical protein
LQFQKRIQLFIGLHNEPLSVTAMCVNNPDCSPVGINRCDTAPTPSGFAEIVSDDFPVLHALHLQTPHVPPRFAQCPQWLQVVHAWQESLPVQVAYGRTLVGFRFALLAPSDTDAKAHVNSIVMRIVNAFMAAHYALSFSPIASTEKF